MIDLQDPMQRVVGRVQRIIIRIIRSSALLVGGLVYLRCVLHISSTLRDNRPHQPSVLFVFITNRLKKTPYKIFNYPGHKQGNPLYCQSNEISTREISNLMCKISLKRVCTAQTVPTEPSMLKTCLIHNCHSNCSHKQQL